MVGQVAIGGGDASVEQFGMVAARDHDTHRPAGQRRHLDGLDRPDHLGVEHPQHVLVAERSGERHHDVGGVTREAGGTAGVGQPGGEARRGPRGPDAIGEHIGVEEVLLNELAERLGELVLPLDDDRRVRYRQAERTAEQRGDREPVGDTADHGRLETRLQVTGQRPVRADRGHHHESDGDRAEQRGGATAGSGQAAHPLFDRFTLEPGYG